MWSRSGLLGAGRVEPPHTCISLSAIPGIVRVFFFRESCFFHRAAMTQALLLVGLVLHEHCIASLCARGCTIRTPRYGGNVGSLCFSACYRGWFGWLRVAARVVFASVASYAIRPHLFWHNAFSKNRGYFPYFSKKKKKKKKY